MPRYRHDYRQEEGFGHLGGLNPEAGPWGNAPPRLPGHAQSRPPAARQRARKVHPGEMHRCPPN